MLNQKTSSSKLSSFSAANCHLSFGADAADAVDIKLPPSVWRDTRATNHGEDQVVRKMEELRYLHSFGRLFQVLTKLYDIKSRT